MFSTAVSTFTAIYCGLNWWHYRSIVKRLEDEDEDKRK
jgi:hypothetical protein